MGLMSMSQRVRTPSRRTSPAGSASVSGIVPAWSLPSSFVQPVPLQEQFPGVPLAPVADGSQRSVRPSVRVTAAPQFWTPDPPWLPTSRCAASWAPIGSGYPWFGHMPTCCRRVGSWAGHSDRTAWQANCCGGGNPDGAPNKPLGLLGPISGWGWS